MKHGTIIAVLAAICVLSGCAGLREVSAPPRAVMTPEDAQACAALEDAQACAALDERYQLWGSLAAAAGALELGQVAQLLPASETARIALVALGVIDSAAMAGLFFLRDAVTADYRKSCEPHTAVQAGASISLERRGPRCEPMRQDFGDGREVLLCW